MSFISRDYDGALYRAWFGPGPGGTPAERALLNRRGTGRPKGPSGGGQARRLSPAAAVNPDGPERGAAERELGRLEELLRQGADLARHRAEFEHLSEALLDQLTDPANAGQVAAYARQSR